MAVKGLAGQLQLVFDEFAEKLNIKTDDIMAETAKETAAELRKISPKGHGKHKGEYANSWTVKKDKKNHEFIVHNKDHYRLTHLLEYGHLIVNQYGVWSKRGGGSDKTDANPHIYRAEQYGIKILFDKLGREL